MGQMSTPNGTQAVERAARLLTEIVDAGEALTFSELISRTGLAKSTTSRLLLALERRQLVRREDGAYRAGALFDQYAWRSGASAPLARVARAVLERLAKATRETVNLGIAVGAAVEQIAQVDSVYLLGATNWVGRPVPLHASAQGKVLLAYGATELPPGRLERRTGRTVTNRAVLSRELEAVRQQRFAVTQEELEAGLDAVAAPVFGQGGEIVAALSVSGPASRIGGVIPAIALSCLKEADDLSRMLGHQSRRDGAA
jgi:IclR family acetate operon transcriptional repressor